jgi:hypothetical protein
MADEVEVDVSEAVASLKGTIEALESEISSEEEALESSLGIKRARLAALKRGLKAAEMAASPDIEPVKKPGRKRATETAAA